MACPEAPPDWQITDTLAFRHLKNSLFHDVLAWQHSYSRGPSSPVERPSDVADKHSFGWNTP